MKAMDLVKEKLVTCTPDATVEEAAGLMKVFDVGAVVVVSDENIPVGIITDRDIVVRVVAEHVPCSTKVEDAMTKEVIAISDEEEFVNFIEKIKQSEVRRIVVIDKTGEAVGLVSLGDILKVWSDEFENLIRAVSPEQPKISFAI